MKAAIIVSKQDPAGMGIKDVLLKQFKFVKTNFKFEGEPVYGLGSENKNISAKLYTAEKASIHCENIDQHIDADMFIFATMHRSEVSTVPVMTVHSIGNWSKAEFGGKDSALCIAPSNYMKEAIMKLTELNTIDFEVVQEVTHHGPYLEKPVMFIEIGPTAKQWHNKEAAEIIAKTIFHLVTAKPTDYETAVGIGGLHTAPNFKKIILNTNYAIGHICPKYNLQNLDEDNILQAFEKQTSVAKMAILDWKSLKSEKERIVRLLKDLNIEFTRTDKF